MTVGPARVLTRGAPGPDRAAAQPCLPDRWLPGEDAFRRAMALFRPFEPCPHLAIAVSGGPDSVALLHFARRWTAAVGGQVTALTVDHGLRSESAAECAALGSRLAARGIPHHRLVWAGRKPATGVQAAARQARYDLLGRWCEDHNVLHLLFGHQALDQAETAAMRAERGSGTAGRAGMSAQLFLPRLRVLRPLLAVSPADLRLALRQLGETWIEDPSNHDHAWRRSRMRHHLKQQDAAARGGMPDEAAAGGSAWWLRQAASAAAMRRSDACGVAWLAARHVCIDARGFAWLNRWRALSPTALTGLLEVLCRCIAGVPYPRLRQADRAATRLIAGAGGATLAGCHVVVRGAALLVVREVARTRPVAARERGRWDGRFAFCLDPAYRQADMAVGALTVAGWSEVRRLRPDLARTAPPAPARFSLPALWQADRVLAVPGLGAGSGYLAAGRAIPPFQRLSFEPPHPVVAAGFSSPDAGLCSPLRKAAIV
ncbi:MAG: tRNA lysidine(34) synthetase TilS [Alphaproteobacteria bacterium]